VIENLEERDILKTYEQLHLVPFDPVRRRMEAPIKDSSGKQFKVSKGAP
jgi:H+-transporting ATPase